MLAALMVLMPMIQMIEAPAEIENIVEEKTSARAVTGTLTDSFEQTNDGEASGWVQAEGLDNTASYSLAWSVEADSDGATVTEGSQTLSTGVSNTTIPINTASLVDYETYCLNATLTSGSDTIDSSSTCLTLYPEVGIGGPELSVEIWGWDDGTAEAIIDIDNLAGVETYTLDWELLAGNEESIADSGSEDLTGQLSTIRSTSFTGLADDYHCLEVILSLDGDEVADAWDCFTAVMAGTPEASAHIEDADFGEMEVRALVWNLTSGDEYKVDITVEDTTFAIISLSETHEFNAISPAWNQESSFEQLIPGEYQVNLTVEDITNGGVVAEWNDTFTMESIPIGPPGASFNISDVGDGRISATLDLWNLSTGSTYELVWNQTSDWVDGANGSLSWEAAAHDISFAAFNAGPMPKGVYHWVVQAYVDNYHMATFYPTVSVTSQSPWSPDVGITAYDDGFGGADIGLYGWNLEAGGEYQLDWELASADGTPMQGDSVAIIAVGPVYAEDIDIAAIGKGEYLLTTSLSDAENWYSSAGSIFEITTDPPYVDSDGDSIPDITDQCGNSPPGSTVDGNGCSASQGVWASAETVIDGASIDKALGIDVADNGHYVIGGVTRESDGPSFEGFVDLGAYNDDTCAVHTNGSITCWGDDNTLPFIYKEGDYVEVELGMGNPVSDSSGDAYRDTGACALGDAGALECWNLGTFSTTKSVPSSGTFTSLAGGQHFCAVSTTSTIECWGPDNSGESSDVPLWNNFSSVSTGYGLTCAVTTDKHAECWGITSDETTATNIDPTSSLNEDKYLSIGASTRRACAILIDRSIECYGRGHFAAPATPPAGVFKSIVSNAETINHNVLHKGDTSGASQSILQSKADIGFCAISTDGNLSCWGGPDNIFSTILYDGRAVNEVQIGSAHVCTIDDLGDVWCSNQKESYSGPQQVSAGTSYTCALLSSGNVQCWGRDIWGELGVEGNMRVTISGIDTATAISTGSTHTCALLSSGNVQCWGRNQYGQLGDGSDINRRSPVTVSGIDTATAINSGGEHTCALLSSGEVQCWGRNTNGELGDGTNVDSNTPVTVSGINSATAISTSLGQYTCAILASGNIQCWGANGGGELGDGTSTNSNIPVTVSGINSATAISTGYTRACAVLSSGSLQCWGNGDWGLLGNGVNGNSDIPVTVNGIDTVSDISVGYEHTCAVFDSNLMRCWGKNTFGQLGDGSNSDSTTASSSPSPWNDVNAVSLGHYHTCAQSITGDIRCWGWNNYGQLGDGTTANRNIPTPVIGLSSNTQIQMSDWSKPVTGEATGTTLSTYDDGFIQYYDDSGTLLWSQLIVGNQNETVSSVAIDSENNVIACGFFWGSADFGDGVQYSSTKFADGFIAKYTQSGTLLWIEKISSESSFWGRDFDACNSVVVDSEDNIIIGGTYFTYNLPTVIGSMTAPYGRSETGFVARLDSDGTTEWISSHANITNVRDVAVGPNGDIAIVGAFGWTIEIGGKSFTKTGLGTGGFVAKVDGSTGAFLWGDAAIGSSWIHGLAVAVAKDGSVYHVGAYWPPGNFSDGSSLGTNGGRDVYIARYSPEGAFQWVRSHGGSHHDGGYDATTDSEGGVIVVGSYHFTMKFDGGVLPYYPYGGIEGYAARLSPNGQYTWVRSAGGATPWSQSEAVQSVAFGPNGVLHVVGHYYQNASFGSHNIGPASRNAAFHATMTFDTDGDGVHDSSDSCSGTIPVFVADADGCAPYQLDSDGDGITDNFDQCPDTPAGTTVNGLGCEPPTADETPTCSMFTTTTLGHVETIGVPMETKPEWESLNYQMSRLSEGVYDVGLHCVDPNGDEFSLELVGPVESVQGSGSDVWIYLTDELLKGYETAHRFDYTWTQGTSQENGYAHLILIDPAMATNATKRVALWGGKVNQHWDVDDLEWKTDPDGTSGANIGALATCKKWYPDTAAVELMQHRETITFWTAGNSAPYESTKPIWECVADNDPRVLSGALQSGEAVDASTGTILATIILTTAACGIGAIAVSNRKGEKAEFEGEDEDEEDGESKEAFIK